MTTEIFRDKDSVILALADIIAFGLDYAVARNLFDIRQVNSHLMEMYKQLLETSQVEAAGVVEKIARHVNNHETAAKRVLANASTEGSA